MAKMTREELIENLAKIISGLQVPGSLNPVFLGTAYEPWLKTYSALNLPGCTNYEEVYKELVTILDNK